MNMKDDISIEKPGTIVDLSRIDLKREKPASYRTAIVRIFGNNVYPLQQSNQGSRNLQFILENENRRKNNSQYFWVVNRIVNISEFYTIEDLLRSERTLHVDFDLQELKSRYGRDPEQAIKYATDINNARNKALKHAAENLDVDWIVLLDGNSFLTNEAYDTLHAGLKKAEQNKQYMYFMPMYRLYSNQASLNQYSVIEGLNVYLSGLQEPYLAIHRLALKEFQSRGIELFDTDVAYGKRSKIASLEVLAKYYSDHMGCPEAYHQSSVTKITNAGDDLSIALSCSYVIRLLYWPDGFDQKIRKKFSLLTKLNVYAGKLLQEGSHPEENNFVRSQLRKDSIKELQRNIEDVIKKI